MEDKDYTLIERYLTHDMSGAEQVEIERRALTDPEFGRELSAFQLAVEAIKLAQREDLKNRFRERDKILDKQAQDKNPRVNRRFLFFAIAAVFVVLIAFQFLIRQDRPIDQAQITPQDSTLIEQPTPTVIDTNNDYRADNGSPDKVVEKDKPKKSIINKDRGRELYAANFEPYMDESMDPTSRGDEEDMNDLEKFQQFYWDKKYSQVVTTFNKLTATYRQNDNLKFIYANALMAMDRIDEAITILAEVISNGNSSYSQEANYYIGLAYLKKGNVSESKKFLEMYVKGAGGEQKEKALQIIKEI